MPLISMKCRTRPGARPTRSRSEGRRISTVSSATRRCPRRISSRAVSDLPIPLRPEDQHTLTGHVEQACVQDLPGGELQGQEPGSWAANSVVGWVVRSSGMPYSLGQPDRPR